MGPQTCCSDLWQPFEVLVDVAVWCLFSPFLPVAQKLPPFVSTSLGRCTRIHVCGGRQRIRHNICAWAEMSMTHPVRHPGVLRPITGLWSRPNQYMLNRRPPWDVAWSRTRSSSVRTPGGGGTPLPATNQRHRLIYRQTSSWSQRCPVWARDGGGYAQTHRARGTSGKQSVRTVLRLILRPHICTRQRREITRLLQLGSHRCGVSGFSPDRLGWFWIDDVLWPGCGGSMWSRVPSSARTHAGRACRA